MSTNQNFTHISEFHAWVTNVCNHDIVEYEYRTDGSVNQTSRHMDHVYRLLEIIYPPEETVMSALWRYLEIKSKNSGFRKKVKLETSSE